jgi:hypothetical protein
MEFRFVDLYRNEYFPDTGSGALPLDTGSGEPDLDTLHNAKRSQSYKVLAQAKQFNCKCSVADRSFVLPPRIEVAGIWSECPNLRAAITATDLFGNLHWQKLYLVSANASVAGKVLAILSMYKLAQVSRR